MRSFWLLLPLCAFSQTYDECTAIGCFCPSTSSTLEPSTTEEPPTTTPKRTTTTKKHHHQKHDDLKNYHDKIDHYIHDKIDDHFSYDKKYGPKNDKGEVFDYLKTIHHEIEKHADKPAEVLLRPLKELKHFYELLGGR
eukprot:Polyplicarium_translucidae@DN1682_c0_g1_i2.p1